MRFAEELVISPLVPYDEIQRKAYLEDYLAGHGPDESIDLRHATGDGAFSTDWNVIPSQEMWLQPPSYYQTTDNWRRKIDALSWKTHRVHFTIPDRIARALEPRWEFHKETKNTVLYVGVDLRFPIEEQLEEKKSRLSSIRSHLYRFTGTGPPRDRSENLWRDIYIFLLSEVEGKSVAEIAREVFQGKKKRSQELNVRQIIAKVKAIVEAAGIRSLRSMHK